MLLDTIVIVLRESLEAGVLLSLLMTVARVHDIGLRWLWPVLGLGGLGSWVYASYLGSISEWFDYVGQEIVNAGMQYLLFVALVLLLAGLGRRVWSARQLTLLMVLIGVLALIREVAEILVFYSGYLHNDQVLLKALTSGFIGLAIGLCIGVLVYFGVNIMPPRWKHRVQLIFLGLIAAGLVMQATQLLIQADWVTTGPAVWDSNFLLSEHSMLGQSVYAVFGYEATPSWLEIVAYWIAIIVIVAVRSLRIDWLPQAKGVHRV